MATKPRDKKHGPDWKQVAAATSEQHAIKRELEKVRATLREVLNSRVHNASYQEFVAEAAARSRKSATPTWVYKPKASAKPNQSMFCAVLSDIHFEEVVDPEVVNHVNGYDMEIAEKRLHNFFVNVCRQAFDNLKGFSFDGLVLPLMGDFITGWIHEELQQSNAIAPIGAVVRILKPLKAGIRMMADEFGKVHLPCVIGNHGRTTKKVAHKHPVDSSYDWLIYSLLQEHFQDDKRITFQIPQSTDVFFRIYNHRIAAEHGNLLKGGSNAISGIYPSVTLGNYRKRNFEQSQDNPYDTLLIGDKHQLRYIGSVFVNGSVIGVSEWARDMKFPYERPQQMCFVIDPNHGITWKGEIFVMSPDEPWMKRRTYAKAS